VQPNHYVVREANKQQLAYVYYENELGRRSAAKLLTKDEARRTASNIAKLPELGPRFNPPSAASPFPKNFRI
jgi:hypothetical protein